MKNIKNIIGAFLISTIALAQSSDQNYVKTITYKDSTQTNKNIQVTYFDGLGRPIQKIDNAQSNTGKNIVTHIEYDAFGRQVKEYLPYTSAATTLDYITNPLSELNPYYASPSSANGNPNAEATNNPYSEKLLEASPLDRVLKQAASGDAWAMGGGHEIKLDYQTNEGSGVYAVNLYKATASWNASLNLYDSSIVQNSVYPANELYLTITKDENWKAIDINNNTTHEYKDKEGKVVLKRTFNCGDIYNTYYVYDQYGNLTYVLPPLSEGAIGQTTLDGLCYQYKYDYRNRLAAKKLPGKQWEFIVYDKLDRPVATGPAFSPWGNGTSGVLITQYDAFGRVTQTGWKAMTMTQTSRSGWHTNIINDSNPFVLAEADILTKNYYDNYTFPNAITPPSQIEGQNVNAAVKGLATGSWVRILTLPTEQLGETSCTLYDNKYRPIRSHTTNYLGGYTTVDSKLDFMGKTLYSITKHKKVISDTEIVTRDTFEYSAQDRLLTHKQQINSDPEQLIAKNEYDELGQLLTKYVGGNDVTGSAALQKVDYNYNIRGWLKTINDVNSLKTEDEFLNRDLFAFKINYNQPDTATPLYNGNISETSWRSYSDDILRKYDYSYDHLNRLLEAKYSKPEAANFVNTYGEALTYDKNGNIRTLQRFGGYEDDMYEYEIDMLDYTYHPTNKNQLLGVFDGSYSPQGFNDGNYGDDYTYDANGNMLQDLNKGMQSDITYNHLNLPVKIVFNNSELTKIEYLYNANGVKVQKKVSYMESVIIPCGGGGNSKAAARTRTCYGNAPAADVTHYLNGGFQYKNNVLEFFPHAEGYVRSDKNGYSYVFNYTDHLGNVRVSYEDIDKNGVLGSEETVIGATGANPYIDYVSPIIDENHYYPFGLKHEGYNFTNPTVNKYKYNGKEWQDELGLNLYDYGWRNYDASLGRWMNVDYYSEKYPTLSPYNYVTNNPISAVDPDGRDVYFIIVVNGGAAHGYDAARTRQSEIENSKGFNKDKDHVYFLEVDDLSDLGNNVYESVQDAIENGYGKTVEASFFGHHGGDGPVGEEASEDDLSKVTGNSADSGQLSPEGWKKIWWNFDKDNSIANFYGCNSADFAEKFLDYHKSLKFSSGIGGGAGGSYTYKGEFDKVIWNFAGSSNTYMVDQDNGQVNPRLVYERGSYSQPLTKYIEHGVQHTMKDAQEIYGNPTVKNGKAVSGSN